ncbi:MAG: molybdopterin adenylyltransferase [Gammaproteobacteria bacterium]|nr:molybdopterin adenylyltransferase [Gammaproteobacteria bacterium]
MAQTLTKIGIVTVSERASAGVYEDLSGKAIIDTLKDYLTSDWQAEYRLIPDEQPLIEQTLRELCDEQGCCLVVTTSGTGPAKRDVTPEAIRQCLDAVFPAVPYCIDLMHGPYLQYNEAVIKAFRPK